ncbi:MAG: hypothetical protein KC619_31830, partial [Myxococcales bacterium]|nr:hypothetical protein [Myxococcales bacterium]
MSEDDDLLDEALGALREESRDPSEATLERILDSLDGDHVLDEAVAALRAEPMYAESDATLARIHASLAQRPAAGGDALDETLDEATDALRATRTPTRSSRWPMAAAAVVLLAVGLGAPTAWAWSTGRLPALLASIGLGPSVEPPRAPSPTRPP